MQEQSQLVSQAHRDVFDMMSNVATDMVRGLGVPGGLCLGVQGVGVLKGGVSGFRGWGFGVCVLWFRGLGF